MIKPNVDNLIITPVTPTTPPPPNPCINFPTPISTHYCQPETQETWVQSLGQEDPLEKEIATHSSILA